MPGVITAAPPVLLVKTAVRLELAPAVMVAGFATKLVIDGATGAEDDVDPPQPERPPKPRLRTRALAA